MLKNIVLDMGNVLLDFDPEVSLARFCKSGEARDVIRRELFRGPEWKAGDRGLITNAQRYIGVSRRVDKRYHEELRQCVDHWDMCMVPLPGAREFLEKCRARGFGLYVLSNACSLFYSYFPRSFDLSAFDGVVVSSDLHILKPEPGIYLRLLERYGLVPGECLFIDDLAENVAGAEAVGMQGVVFSGDFESVWREILKRV